MKVSSSGMSPDEFREHAKRMSQYLDLKGCRTEEYIERRIRSKKSAQLDGLIKGGFAFRLIIEARHNPHPVYKETLGMDDEEYNWLIEEKKKADSEL